MFTKCLSDHSFNVFSKIIFVHIKIGYLYDVAVNNLENKLIQSSTSVMITILFNFVSVSSLTAKILQDSKPMFNFYYIKTPTRVLLNCSIQLNLKSIHEMKRLNFFICSDNPKRFKISSVCKQVQQFVVFYLTNFGDLLNILLAVRGYHLVPIHTPSVF